jgi:hypothetical protein
MVLRPPDPQVVVWLTVVFLPVKLYLHCMFLSVFSPAPIIDFFATSTPEA